VCEVARPFGLSAADASTELSGYKRSARTAPWGPDVDEALGPHGAERGSIPVITASLLELSGKLFAVTFELLQIVVRELAPLLLDLTLHLFPHAGGAITVPCRAPRLL